MTPLIYHTRPDLISNSKEIYKGLYWAGVVRKHADGYRINADKIQFYLEYSWWDTGQL